MGGEDGAVVATQCADPELDDSSESAAQVGLCPGRFVDWPVDLQDDAFNSCSFLYVFCCCAAYAYLLFICIHGCVAFFVLVQNSARSGVSCHPMLWMVAELDCLLSRLSSCQGTAEQYVPCFGHPVNIAVASWSFSCGEKWCGVDGIRVSVTLSSSGCNASKVGPMVSVGIGCVPVHSHRYAETISRLLFRCRSTCETMIITAFR